MRLARVVLAAMTLSAAASVAAAPCAGFTDVQDTSPFCTNVEWMKNRGITQGCTATLYCPTDPVSRLAMAAFLNRLDRVLPPTLVSANGLAFGSVLSQSVDGQLVVAHRSSGRLHLLPFNAYVGTTTLVYLPQEGKSVYFVTPNCTGTAYASFALWLPTNEVITATGYSVIVEGPSGLMLFASVSSPLPANVVPAQVVAASRMWNGACTAISAAPLQYALAMTPVENLSAVFTTPFQLQ